MGEAHFSHIPIFATLVVLRAFPERLCQDLPEEVRGVKVNFAFENLEFQDGVGSEASAFQREGVELVKPFLIWCVMETSHSSFCQALVPLQLVYTSLQCQSVGFHCILQVWPHYGTVQRDELCLE